MEIRPAERGDVATLARFNRAMAAESEGIDLPEDRVRRGVEALFDDPRRGRYWICEERGVPVGQCMVTYEWSDWRAADFWWIQSVYTDPNSRRRGVYRALHGRVLEEARAAGAAGVRLYVERHNAGARAAYARLGMAAAPYEMMEIDFVISRGR